MAASQRLIKLCPFPLINTVLPPLLYNIYHNTKRPLARMESLTARAPMHEIESVERLALDSLMRELLSS